jgi:hypothetical protein
MSAVSVRLKLLLPENMEAMDWVCLFQKVWLNCWVVQSGWNRNKGKDQFSTLQYQYEIYKGKAFPINVF